MCRKKTIYLLFLVLCLMLRLVSTSSAAERWWSGNQSDLWNVKGNWYDNAVPTNRDTAFLDIPDDTTTIDSTMNAVCDALRVAEWSWNCYLNITGGTLTVDKEMWISTLRHEWGYSQGSVYMSGGTVSIGGDLVVCKDGWWGMLEITGGTIDVGGTLWVAGGEDACSVGAAYGDLYLYGGTITAGNFDSSDLCGGRGFDIVLGQLIIDGDDTADIAAGVNEGWIIAYGGAVPVEYDYNATNSGKTTVKADGCHWTDAGSGSSWDTATNWIGGVPTSSDFAGIVASGTTCEIGSGVNAQCNDCMIAYFSNWGGAGNQVTVRMLGGTLTTQGDLIVGGTDYATGIVDINSGTVDVGGVVDMGDNECSIDIYSGTLKIAGDQTQQVYDDIELGKIIAYGGDGVVLFDYNVTNAGKTTATGGVPTNQNWDNGDAGNSLWNDPDNWVETSVPTKRDIPTIDIADSNCQITSSVDAVCLGLVVGDDAAGTSYLDMAGGTLKVGQNAVPSNVIIGGQASGTGVVNVSGGAVDIESYLLVGNNGTGTLNVSGGTVNIDRALIIAAGTGVGTVNLSGGTINAGEDIINAGLEIKDIGTGLLDVKGGTLILNGDATARVKEYAASGKIVAYGGRGTLNLDYNTTNAGKTTVTATSNSAVAYNPSPAAGATFVSTDPTLTWSTGAGATSHDVYFGTDYNEVDTATTSTSGIYIGNQGTASYSPNTLDEGAVYYWRIDEVSGSTAKGNVWKFHVECPNDLRTTINFNADWLYYRGDISGDAASASSYDDSGWKSVHVPHNFKNIPSDVAGWVFDKEGINWYRKYFRIPAEYSGKKVFIEFEGVDNKASVWINGTSVSSHHGTVHKGAFLPFTVDVTDYVGFGSTVNVLAVKADNAYDDTIPEYSRVGYGGLWRNVKMHITDKLHVTDAVDANVVAGGGVFVSFSNISSSSASVQVKTHVENEYASSKTCSVKTVIMDANDDIVTSDTSSSQVIAASGTYTFTQNLAISDPCMWHPDSPYLYTVITGVYDNGVYVDGYSTPIGIKTIDFDDINGFSINGERLMWIGTNQTQIYPWTGINMSEFQQKLDVQRMRDVGFQCVRNAHCPMSKAYMQACDELGLMTIDQIPGFHYYAAGEFEQNSYRDMRDMIRRDRNRASVVIWELSLNESDYTDSYAQNAVAIGHTEIPQEPHNVGGWLWDSSDVFDVFMCAAQHGAREYYEGTTPLVIDEHGHWDYGGNNSTSDAARGDSEAAMLQQAWNHQESHHLNRALTDLCGDNVWLFSDSDVTLSSGTVDMFRLPKFSYYFWQSQRDPNLDLPGVDSGPMVYIANYWKSDSPNDVKVFSNCDQVKLYVNDELKATQSPDTDYPTACLLQPPFTFSNITWESGELKAEGLIGGQVVATHTVNTPSSASGLSVDIDTMGYDVTANGEDMVFVYVTVVDSSGNIVPNATNTVTLTVTGPATLVSSAVADAEAGIASFLIRTMSEVGTITASATASGLSSDSDSVSTIAQTDKIVWVDEVYVPPAPPGKATNPSPNNTETDVMLDADLSWTAGSGATSHDVYFGTDSTPDETEFKGNQAGVTYDPCTLSINTTYYWRIDEKNDEGTTTGDVWSFTTGDGTYDDVADGETTISGTVTSGDYTDTHTSDDTYEAIEEIVTGGKPSSRQSYLEHKWTIDVTGGNTVTFYVEAHHTSNSENDDFVFAYSTNDSTYYNMVTVTKTSDDDNTQSYSLPGDLSGTVYIRVKDTDQTSGNSTKDTIYIDHMYILSEQ